MGQPSAFMIGDFLATFFQQMIRTFVFDFMAICGIVLIAAGGLAIMPSDWNPALKGPSAILTLAPLQSILSPTPEAASTAQALMDSVPLPTVKTAIAEKEPAPPVAKAAPIIKPDPVKLQFRRTLNRYQSSGAVVAYEERLLDSAATAAFYQRRDYDLAWSTDDGLRAGLADLLHAIDASYLEGLWPADYHSQAVQALKADAEQDINAKGRISNATQTALDVLATDAYMMLADHYTHGRVTSGSLSPAWQVRGNQDTYFATLEKALTTNSVSQSLRAFLPNTPEYAKLRQQLADMRAKDAPASTPLIETGELLKKGSVDARVGLIKDRLKTLGYYTPPAEADAATEYTFDETLSEAMKTFQDDFNLQSDGFVSDPDILELNRTHNDRIDQIRANMERWRWLPNNLGAYHLRVNIPNYFMQIWEAGKVVFESDAAVGRSLYQTPVMSDKIEYLVLNPSWNVPVSIAKREVIPSFIRDPGRIERDGFELIQGGKIVDASQINWESVRPDNFPYQIRQKPGPTNAMGRVKFMFPNKHAVYLHDSSFRASFEFRKRSHSSGCVRIERPVDLTHTLMTADNNLGQSDIEAIWATQKETRVNFKESIPIHLMYWTVVPDINNDPRYLYDIYRLDQKMVPKLRPRGNAAS